MATLTPEQARAVELLAAGGNDADVAEVVGVNRSTLWRWRKHRAFADALRGIGANGAPKQHGGPRMNLSERIQALASRKRKIEDEISDVEQQMSEDASTEAMDRVGVLLQQARNLIDDDKRLRLTARRATLEAEQAGLGDAVDEKRARLDAHTAELQTRVDESHELEARYGKYSGVPDALKDKIHDLHRRIAKLRDQLAADETRADAVTRELAGIDVELPPDEDAR